MATARDMVICWMMDQESAFNPTDAMEAFGIVDGWGKVKASSVWATFAEARHCGWIVPAPRRPGTHITTRFYTWVDGAAPRLGRP